MAAFPHRRAPRCCSLCLVCGALRSPCVALQSRMQKIYEASVFDPEAFRTRMAQTDAAEIGLGFRPRRRAQWIPTQPPDRGFGTQVFATTFVQWAAREALRRAQPVTLLARFETAPAREPNERIARRSPTQAGARSARPPDRGTNMGTYLPGSTSSACRSASPPSSFGSKTHKLSQWLPDSSAANDGTSRFS